jgi:ABC-type antimicrobial peptide transport system permease subunit
VGLYGVLAYQVSQRTREIGIRMALGSAPGAVLRLVLGEGLWLVAIGVGVGVAGAALLRGVIASQLYDVSAFDPRVILSAIAALTLTAIVAAFGPARRAARVNPVIALSDQ